MAKEKIKKSESELGRIKIPKRENYKRMENDPDKITAQKSKKKLAYIRRITELKN